MNWKHGLIAFSLVLVIGVIVSTSGAAEEAEFDTATVHLSPSCGCCIEHAQYLERSGVEVEVIEHSNAELNQLWEEKGVPEDYRACHLTELGDEGADIKGHVPVDVFNQVVEEQPETDVITLPGMPQGSPVMPGAKSHEWTFYYVQDGEVTGEFTTR